MTLLFFLFKQMVISKMLTTNQHKEECIYHKQLITHLEKDHDYQQLITKSWTRYNINQVSYQPIISCEEPMRNVMNRMDLCKKMIITDYADRSKSKHDKKRNN